MVCRKKIKTNKLYRLESKLAIPKYKEKQVYSKKKYWDHRQIIAEIYTECVAL
jgi:hypothetical protein